MKNILITILILFAFLQNTVNAQLFNREINKGFFFYEGKYIEPPYKITTQDSGAFTTILINGYPFLQMAEIDMRKHYKDMEVFYGYPIGLTKESPLHDFVYAEIDKEFESQGPFKKYRYLRAATKYYYIKYPYKQASDSIMKYIRNAPNVKSYDGIRLETFNGDTMYIETAYSPFRRHTFEEAKYSKTIMGKIKLNPKRIKRKDINRNIKSVRSLLKHNKVVVSTSLVKDEKFTVAFLSFLLKIDTLNTVQRKAMISEMEHKSLYIPKEFIFNFELTPNLKNRINKYLTPDIKKNTNDTKPSSTLKNSPNHNTIKAWVPYQYESGAFYYAYSLVDDIYNYTNEQDYLTQTIYKSDLSYGANMLTQNYSKEEIRGNCTLENFKNMAGTGIITIHAHGMDSIHDPTKYGTLVSLFKSQNDAVEWCGGETNLIVFETEAQWLNGNAWGVRASKDFALEHFKPQNDANSTITFLNTCVGYNNEWGKSMGGVCFSYNSLSYEDDVDNNLKQILKRMNGSISDSEEKYRTASAAYNNALNEGVLSQNLNSGHQSVLKIYPTNSDITLCPTIESKSPEADAYITATMGTGYIEFDTWCDAGVELTDPFDPQSPIYFECVPQNAFQIDYIEWDNPVGGKSKRINYSWNVLYNQTHVDVEVHFNTDMIRSWTNGNGDGHRLDFDGVTPNAEPNAYYTFTINPDQDLNPNFQAESQQVQAGEDVTFINMSSGSVESQEWHFEGGTPSISYEDNPIVVYNSPGTYDVSLTVSDRYSTLTETKENYITVTENSPDYYTVSGYVEDALFYNIPGATILAESSTGEITDSDESNGSGAYELSLRSGGKHLNEAGIRKNSFLIYYKLESL